MATEKRLIDANDTTVTLAANASHVLRNADGDDYSIGRARGIMDAVDLINKLPTVDAVKVVRCKDCKHYDNSEGIYWCHLNSKFYPGGFDWHSFPEDGFCSYGERKDNA